jgi:hypothetical protein
MSYARPYNILLHGIYKSTSEQLCLCCNMSYARPYNILLHGIYMKGYVIDIKVINY